MLTLDIMYIKTDEQWVENGMIFQTTFEFSNLNFSRMIIVASTFQCWISQSLISFSDYLNKAFHYEYLVYLETNFWQLLHHLVITKLQNPSQVVWDLKLISLLWWEFICAFVGRPTDGKIQNKLFKNHNYFLGDPNMDIIINLLVGNTLEVCVVYR